MPINRYEGKRVTLDDLRMAAKFLRGELREGADVLRLNVIAKWIDGVVEHRVKFNKSRRIDPDCK